MKKTKVILYADGAYSRSKNIGGYAFIIQFLKWNEEYKLYELIKEKKFSDTIISTTNNRMELMAVISGLQCLTKPCQLVEVVSDSTYVTNTINKWIDSFVLDSTRLNLDLMIQLHKEIKKHKIVKGIWVRGHNGDTINERVNELAQKAAGTWK
jgi:ribonuclease HI